ncbi:sulfotransferase 6B1-like isoform X2 [Pyxicephalus adspersus]|uniref:sulfotransferase 6B1-like isoform X2 n=1 Tax=Pyxicephalus adspersus TaxID=30357 RepID=UPI003B5A40F2
MAESKQTADRKTVQDLFQTTKKTSPEDLLLNYNGILYPSVACSKEIFEALETFEAREDDLLIASSPKCGTNWVIQILSEMVSILKNQETVLDHPTLEFGNQQTVERMKKRLSPRIISTHLRIQKIPKSFFQKNTKILLVIRNPKDTATSYFNFHNNLPGLPTYESWDLFFKDFMRGNVCYGSYFEYVSEWNKYVDDEKVMAVTFEAMKTDSLTQLKKISEFFRLPLTEEQLREVERRTSFTSMKEKSKNTHGKIGEALFRKGKMASSEEKLTKKEIFRAEMKKVAEKASKMKPEELQFKYKGILYPSLLCSEATFQAMEKLEAREDDVFIITYPKCGTNWTIQILHEMLFELHNKEPTLDQAMLEFGKPDKYEYLNQQPSPRVMSSHITYENIPKTFFEKKTKILLILRNPKDTAVSYYHFSNNNPVLPSYESWDLFFKDYLSGDVIYGSYFDYTLQWEKHIDDGNILVLTFEDMKMDLPKELRKISDFYGLSLTDEQIKKVHEKTTFKSMKENSGNTHGNLGNVFFRKGEIGDWKNLFTEEQSKELDAKFEKYLAGTKLGEMINYEKYCTF